MYFLIFILILILLHLNIIISLSLSSSSASIMNKILLNKNLVSKSSLRLNSLLTSNRFSSSSSSSSLSSSLSSLSSTLPLNKNEVRVVTYNVLSSSLAAPDYFFTNKAEELFAENRLQRIYSKLDQELSLGSIICLQELSTLWTSKLHQYFYKNDYYLITGSYGNKFNGYMGVGIAIPKRIYNINDVSITRIADTYAEDVKDKKNDDRNNTNGILKSLKTQFKKIISTFGSLIGINKNNNNNNNNNNKEKLDPWYEANKKMNQMVIVKLVKKEDAETNNNKGNDNCFYVGTYHMPCMFKLPAVMMIHCAASTQYMQKVANGKPYIFCGDFNITPDSLMYQMLISGKGNMTSFNLLPYNNFKFLVEPLKSAYKEYNSVEPLYTNYAQTKGSSSLFKGTLDYIFMSKDWNVQNVLQLPKEYPQSGLPSLDEPSDHILLGATMSTTENKK